MQRKAIDFVSDPDLAVRDLSYSRSRARQLVDLTKASFFDMGFGPRDDEGVTDEPDEDWPIDRLEIYVKENPRGPGYVSDFVFHSENLPVTVYGVLVNRGNGLEVGELELFRRNWGCLDGSDNYLHPDTQPAAVDEEPPSLITSDVLRRIPIGDIISRAGRQLADESWRTHGVRVFMGSDLKPEDLSDEQRRALENSTSTRARRRGRPELSDELLIEVAEAYIDEAGRGRGAHGRLSAIFDRPEATIRDWVSIARRRGFLAPTKPGRPGAAPGPNLPSISRANTGGGKPNFTRARRRTIIRMIEGEGLLDADLTEDARLLYVVAALVCNDVGVAKQADLQAAMRTPHVVEVAVEILNKARVRAHNRNRPQSRPAKTTSGSQSGRTR